MSTIWAHFTNDFSIIIQNLMKIYFYSHPNSWTVITKNFHKIVVILLPGVGVGYSRTYILMNLSKIGPKQFNQASFNQ